MNNSNRWIETIRFKLSLRFGVWKIKRGYRYYQCKACGHRFRVQKEVKTNIRCPNCGNPIKRISMK